MTHLIAFRDGSDKRVTLARDIVSRIHSEWIRCALEDGSVILVNPDNVNYIHDGVDAADKVPSVAEQMEAYERKET